MRVGRYDDILPSRRQRQAFACGVPSLDRWLATQARQSLRSRDAVTYLLIDGELIAGYYCLSAGEVGRVATPGELARGSPERIPVVRMGRFAIAASHQGQGWGAELLRHALLTAYDVGQYIGARAMIVDATNADAATFYQRFGFVPSPTHPLQLLCDLREVGRAAGHN